VTSCVSVLGRPEVWGIGLALAGGGSERRRLVVRPRCCHLCCQDLPGVNLTIGEYRVHELPEGCFLPRTESDCPCGYGFEGIDQPVERSQWILEAVDSLALPRRPELDLDGPVRELPKSKIAYVLTGRVSAFPGVQVGAVADGLHLRERQ
jgi:hypothetical protein